MTHQAAKAAHETRALSPSTQDTLRPDGLTHCVNAAIDEIRACINERRDTPTSLARRRLAAHHAAARLRRRMDSAPGKGVQP